MSGTQNTYYCHGDGMMLTLAQLNIEPNGSLSHNGHYLNGSPVRPTRIPGPVAGAPGQSISMKEIARIVRSDENSNWAILQLVIEPDGRISHNGRYLDGSVVEVIPPDAFGAMNRALSMTEAAVMVMLEVDGDGG